MQSSHRRRRSEREDESREKEFEERVLDLARVTRVTKGGKRMRFRATVVIGDRKGRVGFATEKGADVALAVGKANRVARKRLIRVPLVRETIPHETRAKFSAALVLLKPAPPGTGVKAGGATRVVLELAGVPNIVGKQLGAANKINNVKAVMEALKKLRKVEKKVEISEQGAEVVVKESN
ncbi:30S ribosomal protein S5 [Candidatus Uhrbacteria bacterium]|nr:30S ribosomal protein S5 [Candidatus Uhrbacteria bacterium]